MSASPGGPANRLPGSTSPRSVFHLTPLHAKRALRSNKLQLQLELNLGNLKRGLHGGDAEEVAAVAKEL